MFFFKKRKKVQTQQQPSEPAPESLCVTTVLTSEQTSILDIANLQGIGQREQQQDAFGISPADRYETDGILAVLCDAPGRSINSFTATAVAPLSLPGFWEINCTSGASETATFFCSANISSMH